MEEVYSFIRNNIKQNSKIVIGVSGGPDSMALLFILKEFREKLNLNLICAHVNHNKRPESEKEKEDVKSFCEQNNIIFEYIKIENWGEDNFHNEARSARYNFFEELIKKYDANYLMTAHHADDLIETILMRIVRGSSLKGYGGFERIINKETYKIIRPLLTVTKEEILEFIKYHNIPYAVDSSNTNDMYTRNRYRKQIVPFLKKEDKNVHKKFIKFNETLIEASEFIDKETDKVFNKVFQEGYLDIEKFELLEKIIQTKIIYNILEKIYGDDLLIITDAHVELIFDLIKSQKANTLVHLPNNIIVSKTYNLISFDFEESSNDLYEIEIHDIVSLPNGKIIQKIDDSSVKSNFITRLNSKEITLPLYVRNRKDGDKIEVKGMLGSKKISHIFIDEKIKGTLRNEWPIVLDSNNKIIWIPGLKKSKFDKEFNEEYDIILEYK